MSGGELRESVAFEQIAESDSSYGLMAGDWEEMFRTAARIRPLRGGEPVLAQRLQGVQPVVIKVRSFTDTRLVDTAWRVRNVRSGVLYNIRAITPDERGFYIDLLCEAGPAV